MKQKTFKKLLLGVGSLQLLLGLGVLTATEAVAAPVAGSNAAVSTTADAQQVASLVAKIKEGAPKGLTNKNIASAITAAITANGNKPSTAVMAAALNQLNLSGSALNKAVSTAFTQIGGKQYELVAAMLKDAKSGGESKYNSTLATFNNALGRDTVQRATDKIANDARPVVSTTVITPRVSIPTPTGTLNPRDGIGAISYQPVLPNTGDLANIEPAAGGDVYNG